METTPQFTPRSSRRNFFTTGALALGVGASAVTITGRPALAQTTPAPVTDIDILNFALTLEHLEAAFYNQGLTRFSASDFTGASFVPLVGSLIGATLFDNFKAIRDHENVHVETLKTTIRSLGGVPVDPCQYNFGYTNFDGFVAVATLLENTGVMAYNGALGMIQSPALRTAGATIATVEARHAAYLNLISLTIPFPAAFDMGKTMQEILAAAAPFITSCVSTPGAGGGATTKAVAGPKDASTIQQFFLLDGSASVGFDSKPLKYSWIVLNGTAGLTGASTATPTANFLLFGPAVFELTVTDSAGGTAKDTVTINYAGNGK